MRVRAIMCGLVGVLVSPSGLVRGSGGRASARETDRTESDIDGSVIGGEIAFADGKARVCGRHTTFFFVHRPLSIRARLRGALEVERRRDPEDRQRGDVEVVEDHVGRRALAHARQLGEERQVAEDELARARDRRRALGVALGALEVAEARVPARAGGRGRGRAGVGGRGRASGRAGGAVGRIARRKIAGRGGVAAQGRRRTGTGWRRSRRTRCS